MAFPASVGSTIGGIRTENFNEVKGRRTFPAFEAGGRPSAPTMERAGFQLFSGLLPMDPQSKGACHRSMEILPPPVLPGSQSFCWFLPPGTQESLYSIHPAAFLPYSRLPVLIRVVWQSERKRGRVRLKILNECPASEHRLLRFSRSVHGVRLWSKDADNLRFRNQGR